MRLPYEILQLFDWLLDEYLRAAKARIVVLMGRHNSHRYSRIRPEARPFTIDGHVSMFGTMTHGYAEYSEDGTKVVRVLLASQHPESWRYPVPSAKKLLLENSLSAAMSLAFGPTQVVLPVPIRKTTQSIIGYGLDDLRAAVRGTKSFKSEHRDVPSGFNRLSPGNSTPKEADPILIALVCRAFYAEHRGIELQYEDLPEELQPFYHPTSITENDCQGFGFHHGKLTRALSGIDKYVDFDMGLARTIIPLDIMSKLLNEAHTPMRSNLWPMWNRILSNFPRSVWAPAGRWLANSTGGFQVTEHSAGLHYKTIKKFLTQVSTQLTMTTITSTEYSMREAARRKDVGRTAGVFDTHEATTALTLSGIAGSSGDSLRLLTSYFTHGPADSHKRASPYDPAKGSTVQDYYKTWEKKASKDGMSRHANYAICDQRRAADFALFCARKDRDWIKVQLSRLVFRDHREQLPEEFRAML